MLRSAVTRSFMQYNMCRFNLDYLSSLQIYKGGPPAPSWWDPNDFIFLDLWEAQKNLSSDNNCVHNHTKRCDICSVGQSKHIDNCLVMIGPFQQHCVISKDVLWGRAPNKQNKRHSLSFSLVGTVGSGSNTFVSASMHMAFLESVSEKFWRISNLQFKFSISLALDPYIIHWLQAHTGTSAVAHATRAPAPHCPRGGLKTCLWQKEEGAAQQGRGVVPKGGGDKGIWCGLVWK